MQKAKILVLGSVETGKTAIANFLSDASENSSADYRPTQGVRILEFEVTGLKGKLKTADVELWDCSGDKKFESCWPAMGKDAIGILFVLNADKSGNQSADLSDFFEYFVKKQSIKDSQCHLLILHASKNSASKIRPPNQMNDIELFDVSLEDGESLRQVFVNFVSKLFKAMSERHDQEELSILNQ